MGMRPVYAETADASAADKTVLIPMNWRETPFNITLQTVVTGTVEYSVEFTNDDIRDPAFTEAGALWTALTGMSAATANALATLISPVTCLRLKQTDGSGSVELQVISAGN